MSRITSMLTERVTPTSSLPRAPQSGMRPRGSTIIPILGGEIGSSAVSLTAAYLVNQHSDKIAPAVNLLAKLVYYPLAGGKMENGTPVDAAKFEKAKDEASVALKGSIMTGVGLASFFPIQQKLHGKWTSQDIKQAVIGKSAGLVAAIVSMGVIGKCAPDIMQKVDDAAKTIATPICTGFHHHKAKDGKESADSCEQVNEMCKLFELEGASSAICALVNFAVTKRMGH